MPISIYLPMLTFLYISAHGQMDGEFWWLKDNVKKLNGKDIDSASIEELSPHETDDSDKIIFASVEVDNRDSRNYQYIEEEQAKTWKIYFPGWNYFAPPETNTPRVNYTEGSITINDTNNNSINSDLDELVFNFPEDIATSTKNTPVTKAPITNSKLSVKPSQTETEHICNYMDENKCQALGGSMYRRENVKERQNQAQSEVCCVLPLIPSNSNISETNTRRPSDNQIRTDQQRRYSRSATRFQILQKKKPNRRISTQENEYEDPYLNIRNSGNRKPFAAVFPFSQKPADDYVSDEYDEYTDEVPTPGQLGVAVDSHKPQYWSDDAMYDSGEDEGVIDTGIYGQPALDPRLDHRLGIPINQRPKIKRPYQNNPNNLSFDKGSHVIRYHSIPNFHVLENFKLLNLIGERSKRVNNGETSSGLNVQVDVSRDYFEERQMYDECATPNGWRPLHSGSSGEASPGSHPWLGLMVRQRQQRRSVCYATLVHPRAAVTAASCVIGAVTGEVSFVAGLWDLHAVGAQVTRRAAQVHLHARFSSGDLTHDVALLYWSRPLKPSENIKPVCLADPRSDQTCLFVGWNGKQRALRPTPHWQRTTIWKKRDCSQFPDGVFCSSISADDFVSGVGGSLVCGDSDRVMAVGVVVRPPAQHSPAILLPIRQWTRRALTQLNIL